MAWLDGGRLGADSIGQNVNLVLFPRPDDSGCDSKLWVTVHRQLISTSETLHLGDFHSVSIYGFKVASISEAGVFHLEIGPHGCSFRNLRNDDESWQRTMSVCSGMGGGILGLHAAGFSCAAACDKGKLATLSLGRNFQCPIIHGDLADSGTLVRLHQARGPSGLWLEAGYPCQPFSALGDMKGFGDARAWTFVNVLQAGWSLQVNGYILECVVGAKQSQEVRTCLAEICECLGLKQTEVVLHLDQQWANRRSRWWVVLYPASWPDLAIPDLPPGPWRRVGDLIPFWPIWPLDEERQLQWTEEEMSVFKDDSYGACDRRLSMTQAAPTILHSAGNHLQGCPCGCRSSGFSEDRLRKGGIHLIEVITSHHEGFHRHLHPREAGLLLGVRDDYDYGNDMRGALCLLGQIASPLQATWIGLHLQECHRLAKGGPINVNFTNEVALTQVLFGDELRSHAQACWPFPACFHPGTCTIHSAFGTFDLNFAGGTTVHHLLEAQRALSRSSTTWQLYCDASLVLESALLRPGLLPG